MAEVYTGPKFATTFSGRQTIGHPWLTELIACARRFGTRGWAEANNGYVAARSGNGMVIKTAGASLANLGPEQLAEVIDYDPVEHKVLAIGPSEPSSESAMAWMILRHREDAHAIIHIHAPAPPQPDDVDMMRAAGVSATATEIDYGTLDLAQDCLAGLRETPTVWLRDHGYVTIGASLPEAEHRLLTSLAALHPELELSALEAANPTTEAWSTHLARSRQA